jgi:SAM-dependent methyltransferase
MYSKVYDELFRRVPLHPQLTRVEDPQCVAGIVREKMQLLSYFLKPSTVFLEVGSGDCRLTLEVARRVSKAYGLDVSEEVSKGLQYPANFEFVLSNGTNIPVPPGSITVAYSYQLIEHVHPDDALEQLTNIYRALAPGGVYICITPNSLSGPHDVSRHFDAIACGFHMKEYTLTELGGIFRQTGFHEVSLLTGLRGSYANIPLGPVSALERLLSCFEGTLSRKLAKTPVVRNLLMAAVVGRKS